MNDYFDAFEQELKAAVPRAARSHRRGRSLPFRLGPLVLLIAVALLPTLGFAGGLTDRVGHHQTHFRPAAHHAPHRRAPRRPDELTLLKGLVALRRKPVLTGGEAQTVNRRMHTVMPVPVTTLLRFAAGTAALGIQRVLASSRRRINDPPRATTAAGAVHITRADLDRCGARQHTHRTYPRPAGQTATRPISCRVSARRVVAGAHAHAS